MNSSHLTHDQLEPLAAKTQGMTDLLNKLQSSLQANGFPADDELLRLTLEAFHRVQHLRMKLHYLRCEATRSR